MDGATEADLAWELLEQHRSSLTVAELNSSFVKLGVGECEGVIELVLKAVARERDVVSQELVDRLTTWVDGYGGHPHQRRLRGLVALVDGNASPSTKPGRLSE
jgi:hypothetical protein